MKGLIASLMLLLAFGTVPATAAKSAETLRVQINKEKRFAKSKLSIRFVELIEDSRCPVDTNCIWAGNAKIKIRVTKNGRSQELTLDTNGPNQAAVAEGYSIKLISLTPAPRSNIRINRNGYVATFEAVMLTR
ncbi:MAG: hypothetical protein ABI646_04225 [Acidobacteriota bacterium]